MIEQRYTVTTAKTQEVEPHGSTSSILEPVMPHKESTMSKIGYFIAGALAGVGALVGVALLVDGREKVEEREEIVDEEEQEEKLAQLSEESMGGMLDRVLPDK